MKRGGRSRVDGAHKARFRGIAIGCSQSLRDHISHNWTPGRWPA